MDDFPGKRFADLAINHLGWPRLTVALLLILALAFVCLDSWLHAPKPVQPTLPPLAKNLAARLAVVIDDLGYEKAATDALLQMRLPITYAIIPFSPMASEVSKQVTDIGGVSIIHLPM